MSHRPEPCLLSRCTVVVTGGNRIGSGRNPQPSTLNPGFSGGRADSHGDAESRRKGGEIRTEAMPVGLCSAMGLSRSNARRAPVKGDRGVCGVRGSQLEHEVGQPLADQMGTPRRPSLPGWALSRPMMQGTASPTPRGLRPRPCHSTVGPGSGALSCSSFLLRVPPPRLRVTV